MTKPKPIDTARPRIVLTIGDVAGIGPEVILRAWNQEQITFTTRPVVVGCYETLCRARDLFGRGQRIISLENLESLDEFDASPEVIPCLDLGRNDDGLIPPGRVDRRAGEIAYHSLIHACELARDRLVDAIVTLPMNKESLHAAGIRHPGHTEILAEFFGVPEHAMMLFLEADPTGPVDSLAIVHVTLHMALREVFTHLTIDRVHETILLITRELRPILDKMDVRVGVAGLNPHAGESGLFGEEELTTIGPAIERARRSGCRVEGPIAADTLFHRAFAGEFDAVVAMYHDQGHCAVKTIAFDRAVNVTLGLPIVRTSVAHGTAFDIAWQGQANPSSLIRAVNVAARFAQARNSDLCEQYLKSPKNPLSS